jgi:anti-sigma-K factor RskA
MSATDDDAPLSPEEARSALAAEAALSLLTGSEAAEARRLIAGDPAFAAAVRGWHERFAALAHTLPEETPSPSVRARLNERLADRAAAGGRHEDRARRRSPLAWIGALAGAAVLAAALWLVPPMLRPQAPMAAAELVAEAPVPMRVETLLQADGRTLVVTLMEGAMPEGRDAELWWIAGAEAVPVSIGLAPHSGSSRLVLPENLAYAPGVQLAISDEPRGGSPTGQATGPVLAIAPLTTL